MLLNRSFARRIGKSLTTTQNDLINNLLPHHLIDDQNIKLYKNIYSKIILEIGIGSGIHFVNIAKNYSKNLYLGAEVYINGIASTLSLAKENKVNNFLLWPNDVDLLMPIVPTNFLDEIYILFPDPWPKVKHRKRRIINIDRILILASKLKLGGKIIFATDINDYYRATSNLFRNNNQFDLQDNLTSFPYDEYIPTKYHQIAIKEDREVKFLQAILKSNIPSIA